MCKLITERNLQIHFGRNVDFLNTNQMAHDYKCSIQDEGKCRGLL
jgi:hypothetical protein